MGFAWKTAVGKRMVTAGHCLPTGAGTVSSYNAHAELTTWTMGTGTVQLPTKPNEHGLGDTALVVTGAPKTPAPAIFTGGPTSATKWPVKTGWPRDSVKGDHFCISGSTSGQQCNWKVTDARDYWRKTDAGTLDSATVGTHPSYCVSTAMRMPR